MSEGFAYLDIILFAMVAGFIALRLRNVLGKKTGDEQDRPSRRLGRTLGRSGDKDDNVVPMPPRPNAPPPPPSAMDEIAVVGEGAVVGVRDIKNADKSFDPEHFVQGAQAAFGMILEAFANGDKETLRNLLADDVYASFASVIDQREADGHAMDAEILDMSRCSIEDASLSDTRALVTVHFVTEQRNTLRDADGNAVDGESDAEEIVDFWTFERDVSSDDPNWRLTETRAPN